jgi:histidyl-tRNA synthetase
MIKAVRGTKDILPNDSKYWQYVEDLFREAARVFNYKELRTPIFESTDVFCRSIGDSSDIVNKEMYTFADKGDESLTLRPEMTAALVRCCIQHNLLRDTPLSRLWYFGPFFRYERPQKGRQRQFHQFGVECIGSEYPDADVEVITLAAHLIESLGIKEYKLLLNTLGSDDSRKRYREALVEFFEAKKEKLSADSVSRLQTNPLRILDSKDKGDIEVIKDAPLLSEYLDDESIAHFDAVKSQLDNLKIPYEIDPLLVRGLDYYNHTVFEFRSTALGSQDSFGGGGRYDGLFEQLGGKSMPAVGFAMGVERLMIILEDLGVFEKLTDEVDAYIIQADDSVKEYCDSISLKLREMGLSVTMDLKHRKFKAQFTHANKINAKFALIVGEDEMNNNVVTRKNMVTGEQDTVPFNQLNCKFLN